MEVSRVHTREYLKARFSVQKYQLQRLGVMLRLDRSEICGPVTGRELLDKRRQRDATAGHSIDAANSPTH